MTLEKNRTIIIGDIHGCYDEFKELLLKVNYNPENDRLISVGDLVHKGPKSWKVLKFFYKNKLEVVLGNHDAHFLNFLKGNSSSYPDGEKILLKCKLSKSKLINWISSWPTYIEASDFIVVHAALNPAKENFLKTSTTDMISARYYNVKTAEMIENSKKYSQNVIPWYHAFDCQKLNNKKVIFGHWAQPLARFFKNFRCLDTGCCYGGALTCLILPDDKIVQIKSKQPKKFNY